MSFADFAGPNRNSGAPRGGRPPYNAGGYGNYSAPTAPYETSIRIADPPAAVRPTASPAEYEKLNAAVLYNMKQMSTNINQVQKFNSLLGTTKDGPELRAKLSETIHSTKEIAQSTGHDLKQLGALAVEQTQKVSQQKITKDFQNLLTQFKDISKVSANKERASIMPAPQQPQQQQSNVASRGYRYDEGEDEKTGLIEADTKKRLMQLQQDRQYNDALIAEREDSIIEIERTVTEINEIFRDMATLVADQGLMIDNIESNIEVAQVKTSQAVVELRKANEHQKSARTKMCVMCLIICIIIGVVVGLIMLLKK